MSADLVFHFRAGAPEGGIFTGRLNAGSADEVAALLRQKGFVPLKVGDRPIVEGWLQREITLGSGKRLSPAECESFCRELGLLLQSGVPIADALAIMAGSLRDQKRLFLFAVAVRHGLQLGRPLSQAVDGAGMILPSDLVPVLRAGEASGSPAKALALLSQSYGDSGRFARVYVSALAYPALLLCVSVLVLALIAFFVAPSLAGLFVSMEKPAPFAIAVLAAAASVINANWMYLLLAGAVAVAVLVAGISRSDFRRAMPRLVGRLPVVGSAIQWSATGRFASTLGLGLASGVPMATALPNALMSAGYGASSQFNRLVEQVRAGESLSRSLASAKLLPTKAVHLVAVGERSGQLAEVLSAIAVEARTRFEQRMALVTALLAPCLILIVGSLIGTVIYSVFSALLDINEIAF